MARSLTPFSVSGAGASNKRRPASRPGPECCLHYYWLPAASRRPQDCRRRHYAHRDNRTVKTAPRACGGYLRAARNAFSYPCARR
jgi:hypothetical protein